MAIISIVIFVMICFLAGITFVTNGRPSGSHFSHVTARRAVG
jgi:hypothetical protein